MNELLNHFNYLSCIENPLYGKMVNHNSNISGFDETEKQRGNIFYHFKQLATTILENKEIENYFQSALSEHCYQKFFLTIFVI